MLGSSKKKNLNDSLQKKYISIQCSVYFEVTAIDHRGLDSPVWVWFDIIAITLPRFATVFVLGLI